MKNVTIEWLRKQKWKVMVKHNSAYHTEIFLTDPIGQHVYGCSHCADVDQPNRKIGNKIALGRALKNYSRNIFCEFNLDNS